MTDRPHFELAEMLPDPVWWTITHVWVIPGLRGRGLASWLARLAADGVGQTPDTVGWLSPFTDGGYKVMARVTGDGFHRAWNGELPPFEEVARRSHVVEGPAASVATKAGCKGSGTVIAATG